MDSSSKTKKREAFLEMAKRAGDLPTSALASGESLKPAPDQAARLAQLLIGGLPGQRSEVRVERLAEKLRQLKALDRDQLKQGALPQKRHG